MKIGLTTYNVPHLKTQQLLEGLMAKENYQVTLLAMPFKKYKERSYLIQHRPQMIQGPSASELAKRYGLSLLMFDEANLDTISQLDYILIGGAQLIPQNLLFEKKIINCHCGLTPMVRGLDSFKWAILNDLPLGNTLHFVDSSVDNGPVIYQKKLVFGFDETLEDLAKRMYEEEIEMLLNFETHLKNPLILDLPRKNATKRMPRDLEQEVITRFNDYKKDFLMTENVHHTSIVDTDVEIGDGTKVWQWCHLSEGASIGKSCTLGQNVYVGNNVVIGNKCKIQNNVSVFESVTLEDEVFCGPSVVFTNVKNPRSAINRKDEFLKTIVKKGASIGANATIVCGVTIGEYSFIAAGAVVTKDTQPFSLMAGVPAKQIGWMDQEGNRVSQQPKIDI